VTPFPTVVALRDAWVHTGTSESGDIFAEVEQMVNERFGFGTVL